MWSGYETRLFAYELMRFWDMGPWTHVPENIDSLSKEILRFSGGLRHVHPNV